MNNEIVKCAICKKEFQLKDGDSPEIFLYDPETEFALCRGCHDHVAREMYKSDIRNGRVLIGDTEDGMDRIREEAFQTYTNASMSTMISKIIRENTPQTFKEHLDKYIIGQDRAKKIISVAVYNHYKRMIYGDMIKNKLLQGEKINEKVPDELDKSNIVLLGPSGCGKTAMLKALSKKLGVPFTIIDSSTLTEAGFVGADPESTVRQLWREAECNIEKTERGIIFLDEFDKLARKSGDSGMVTADPGHEGVQQALLKIIEGGKVNFNTDNARRNPDAPTVQVDTTNILFIVGGAFEGIEKIIKNRLNKGDNLGLTSIGNKKKSTSFTDKSAEFNYYIDRVNSEDLIKYGIIPELLGRLPVICPINQLNEELLLKILKEPKNAFIKQYQMLFGVTDRVKLVFEDNALSEIAKEVIKHKTGARGLRTIIEDRLTDIMFDIPTISRENRDSNITVTVTEDSIKNRTKPLLDIKPKKTA